MLVEKKLNEINDVFGHDSALKCFIEPETTLAKMLIERSINADMILPLNCIYEKQTCLDMQTHPLCSFFTIQHTLIFIQHAFFQNVHSLNHS